MFGLPEGWESDYDGKRWFYKYKPSGHIQYHFPSDGDEFPEFIDAAAPVLLLAPEERLESQQQVRRQVGTSPNGAVNNPPRTRMTASARPVSDVWVDDNKDGDDGVAFQPESIMFLGPGTYTEVSPLADEDEADAEADAEEAAAKRTVVGTVELENNQATGVSPMGSEKPTPKVAQSELSASQDQTVVIETQPDLSTPIGPPPPAEPEEPVIHILDGREMPHELPVHDPRQRVDPVGRLAEMATEQTAAAYIEIHPDPVEMSDNRMLAPIETAAPTGIAELPERTSPVEKKEEKAQIDQPQVKSQAETEDSSEKKVDNTHSAEAPLQSEEKQNECTHQPYSPSNATSEATQPMSPPDMSEHRNRRTSLLREASLLLRAGIESKQPAKNMTSPRQTPPIESTATETRAPAPSTSVEQGNSSQEPETSQTKKGITSYPSVLKPGRNKNDKDTNQANTSIVQQETTPGVSKVPSVLRPARGRAVSESGQGPASQSESSAPELPQAPRPAVQRIATEPVQIHLGNQPNGGDQNTILFAQMPQPVIRPASAMPALGPTAHRVPENRPASTQPIPSRDVAHISMPALPPQASQARQQGPVKPTQSPPSVPGSQPASPQVPYTNAPNPYFPFKGPARGTAEFHPVSSSDSLLKQASRRHSSFSPVEVSPMQSRSGSQSSFPVYTPSPISQAQTPTQPTGPFSGPSSGAQGMESSAQRSPPASGPPIPRKIPLHPEQGSYFPIPEDPNQSVSKQYVQSPPLIGSPSAVQRSQSTRQASPLTQPPSQPQTQSASASTQPIQSPLQAATEYTLSRIEEHEESVASRQTPSVSSYSPQHTRANSSVSSIQHSPPMQAQSLYSSTSQQGTTIPPKSMPPRVDTGQNQQQQWQPARIQGTPPMQHHQNSQGKPQGGISSLPTYQMPPQGQTAAYSQMPPQGFAPSGQQPSPQQYWSPQQQSPTAAGPSPSTPSHPSTPMSPGGKGKEKKWQKWLKGSKSPTISAPQPAQHVPPALAPVSIPRPDLQSQQPPNWTTGEMSQPNAWHQGPAASAQYQQGPHVQGFAPQFPNAPQVDSQTFAGQEVTQNMVSAAQSYSQPGPPVNRIPRKPPGSRPQAQQVPITSPTSSASGLAHHQVRDSGTINQYPTQNLNQDYGLSQPLGEERLVPKPLFSKPSSGIPQDGIQGYQAAGSSHLARRPTRDRWAMNPASDYSGDDWGNGNWN